MLTGEDVRLATQEFLHIRSVYWPQLGAAIAAADAGDAGPFLRAPDGTLDRAQVLVPGCLDTPPAGRTFQDMRELQQLVRRESPHLGGAVRGWVTYAGCLGRPGRAPGVGPATPVRGAPPALVTQSTHQALAPYSWGFGLAAQLPGSVVLTRDGDDYSNFLLSQCVRDVTNRYLETRTLPAPGTTCPAEDTPPGS